MLDIDFFGNFLEEKKVNIVDLAHEVLFSSDKYNPNSMVEWVENNRVLNGKKFSYSNSDVFMDLGEFDKPISRAPRPYLLDYLKDPCRDKTIIKCRQSEFTENELNINLFLTMTRPYTQVMHVFPTQRLGEQIARQKIQSAIKNSPQIMEAVEKPLAYTFYKFKNGANYSIGGSWGNIAGRAGSFDKLTFDEYEFHNPTVEGVFLRLIDHSALKQICRISTPLFPGGGIDLKFEEGCKFEWQIVCPECGKVQTMRFPDNLINFFEVGYLQRDSEDYFKKINRVYIGCSKCKAYIDRTSNHYIQTSKWVAEKPHLVGIKNSYRVTAFLLPWKTGKEILSEFHKARYSYQFDNEVLGYASKSKDSSLQELYFLRCENKSLINLPQKISNLRSVSIGVDWGTTDIGSWVVVRAKGIPPYIHKPHIIYIERIDRKGLKANGYIGDDIDHAKRVEQLINIFNPKIVINDANGIGTDRNSYLIRKFPKIVYGCFYDTGEVNRMKLHKSKVIEPIWTTNKVTVSRVGSFRMMMEDYKSLDEEGLPEIFIPLIDEDIKEFVAHHLNVGVQKMFDPETGVEYEVVGSSGADHYAHADNYSKIGFDKINSKLNPAGVI